jgi:hypothetical protein
MTAPFDGALGGGSGGGADKLDSTAGTRTITGNRIEIVSRVPMAADPTDLTPPVANVITLLATGETPAGTGPGGLVELRGNTGVRITSGPPLGPLLPTSSSSTNGIELQAAEQQEVSLAQGVMAYPRSVRLDNDGIDIYGGPSGTVEISQGVPGIGPDLQIAPTGITVDAATGMLTLQSETMITLKVAGGAASITLTPTGIQLKGVLIMLN